MVTNQLCSKIVSWDSDVLIRWCLLIFLSVDAFKCVNRIRQGHLQNLHAQSKLIRQRDDYTLQIIKRVTKMISKNILIIHVVCTCLKSYGNVQTQIKIIILHLNRLKVTVERCMREMRAFISRKWSRWFISSASICKNVNSIETVSIKPVYWLKSMNVS